jgi:CBS domain containing-hemolysin-like protein
MSLLVIYFLITVGVSFTCSIFESVILSVTPAYIAVKTTQSPKVGNKLLKLKQQIDRSLAGILTLNTTANTLGSAGVGAQALLIYGDKAVALTSGLLTLMILIFAEIIPKTIGTIYWKKLAPAATIVIPFFIYITYPFVLMSEVISSLLGSKGLHKVTREEMIMTAELGADEGTLNKKESLVIRNLLMLNKISITDIMTPRSVVFGFEKQMTVGEVFNDHKTIQFSRIPVFNETMDNVEGVILRYKLMEAYAQDLDEMTIDHFMKPIHSLPEDSSVASCLDQFIKRKEHIFIVIDDYGVTTGIITLEDVVETLLGVEIVDEFDSVEDMRKYARELWEERKKTRITFTAPKNKSL